MAPTPKIKLYVDIVSPFGYIAYWLLRNDPIFKSCEVTYIPMFLGGLMKACGNAPPFTIKNKDKWILKERTRWATTFNVPMQPDLPENFAPLTLVPMRAMCALTALHASGGEEEQQRFLIPALDELMKAFWVEHKHIQEKDVVGEIVAKALGVEEAETVMQSLGKEGKEVLTKNTDMAFEDGAFGLPWFVATNSKGEEESFWGVDHLGQVVAHLGLDKGKGAGWRSVL